MGQLDQILESKRAELAALRKRAQPVAPERRPVRLRRGPGQPLRLLAEIKRRSPSAGTLSTLLSVAERAKCYERAGAQMVSVLCDKPFFDGDYAHLTEARRACSLPILCKDFVLDPIQIQLARAYGADAVLLIVRCLTKDELARLLSEARKFGLEPLVEVATLEEARTAVAVGADLIGVNSRDLDTLAMNPKRALDVLLSLPQSVTKLYLSGVSRPEDVEHIAASTADAALIGEALMREDDPTALLKTLSDAAG